MTILPAHESVESEIFDVYDSVEEIAAALEMSEEELISLAGSDDWYEIREYINDTPELYDKIYEAHGVYCRDELNWDDEAIEALDDWYEQIMRDAEKTDAE